MQSNSVYGENAKNTIKTVYGIRAAFPHQDITFWVAKQLALPRRAWSRFCIDKPAGQHCPWKATL